MGLDGPGNRKPFGPLGGPMPPMMDPGMGPFSPQAGNPGGFPPMGGMPPVGVMGGMGGGMGGPPMGGMPPEYQQMMQEPSPQMEPEYQQPGGARGILSALMLSLSEALMDRPGMAMTMMESRRQQGQQAKSRNVDRMNDYRSRQTATMAEGARQGRLERQDTENRASREQAAADKLASEEKFKQLQHEFDMLKEEHLNLNRTRNAETRAAEAGTHATNVGSLVETRAKRVDSQGAGSSTQDVVTERTAKKFIAEKLGRPVTDYGDPDLVRKSLHEYINAQLAGRDETSWSKALHAQVDRHFGVATSNPGEGWHDAGSSAVGGY